MDYRFEEHIRRRLGDRIFNKMKLGSRIKMMKSWEQNVKFLFGNTVGIEGFEVSVPGVGDDEDKNIEDGFHTMQGFATPTVILITILFSCVVHGFISDVNF